MLGSMSDADDAVQEAWLRVSRAEPDEVVNLRAWLTTVVARISLNMLRSRSTRHEDVVDADDCRKKFDTVKSHGVKFEPPKVIEQPWGLIARFHDPDGNMLQFRELRMA